MRLLHASAFIVVAILHEYCRLLFAPIQRKMRYLKVQDNLSGQISAISPL